MMMRDFFYEFSSEIQATFFLLCLSIPLCNALLVDTVADAAVINFVSVASAGSAFVLVH
jgi:hypothetical protein